MKILNFWTLVYFIFLTSNSIILTKVPSEKEKNSNIDPLLNEIKVETEDSLDEILRHSTDSLCIMFYMEHCSWCDKMKNIFKSIIKKHKDITFYYVNGPELKAHQRVQQAINKKIPGYPYFLFMKEKKYIEQHVGGMTEVIFAAKLKKIS